MIYKIQKFIPFLIFSFLIIFSKCDIEKNIYEFDFKQDWKWDDLKKHTENPETHNKIENLKQILSIEDAHFLFNQLSGLDNPADIIRLSELQSIQDSLGGNFYGMSPGFPENTDTIPIPYDFDRLVSTGLFLADLRQANYNSIADTEYPINFSNKDLIINKIKNEQNNVELIIDYSCVKQIINAFDRKSLSLNDALEISNLPGFRQMLAHRRNLGYIPEPLPGSEDLAQFILYASSEKPLDMIWKWLNPWNYFNLADLYMNKEEYKRVMSQLETREEELTGLVSQKINPFVPDNFTYKDTLSIAVNWGIRSWATGHTLGTNIVQFKDNFDLFIQTISHETFHKIQLELCPGDGESLAKNDKLFEDIVNYSFPDKKDAKFYQVLSYIFLEGTASYVGGPGSLNISKENIAKGSDLLMKIYNIIYVDNNNLEAVDELLNEGLKSNGPFYALGYMMTKKIVSQSRPGEIKNILINGTTGFFNSYIEIIERLTSDVQYDLEIDKTIEEKVKELNEIFQKAEG